MFRHYFFEEILCMIIIILYLVFTIDDILKKRMKTGGLIFSTVVFICMCIYTFIISPAFVVGPSMNPTLHNGEVLLISKIEKQYKKFDIIVFYSENLHKSLIKRVIGLPGDTVELKDGRLYINNEFTNQTFTRVDSYLNYGPVIVPEDNYFVMGDNRPNSEDSRAKEVGFIDKYTIKGLVYTLK